MNRIKSPSEGLALQITEPARSAGLVEENNEGEATHLSKVRVHAFDNLLLVADRDPRVVKPEHVVELVSSAMRDTKSIHRAMDSKVQTSGHGYQVQLPPASDAGFRVGDSAPVQPAPGVLVVHRHMDDAARLGRDLVGIRRAQVDGEFDR